MARHQFNATAGGGANPTNPGQHKAGSTATADSGDVYLSYDDTKISGYAQLVSVVHGILATIPANGGPGAGT